MPARTANIDLSHRPRLADLRPLIAASPSLLEARAATPRVTAAKDLKNRAGYADDFLSDLDEFWQQLLDGAPWEDARTGVHLGRSVFGNLRDLNGISVYFYQNNYKEK